MECPSRSFIIFPCATERFQAVPGRTAGSIGCATSRDRAKTHPAPQRNATSVGNIQERTDIPVSALSKEGIKKPDRHVHPRHADPARCRKNTDAVLAKEANQDRMHGGATDVPIRAMEQRACRTLWEPKTVRREGQSLCAQVYTPSAFTAGRAARNGRRSGPGPTRQHQGN